MKMIWAVVPPGCADDVIGALRKAGIQPVTCIDGAGFFGPAAAAPACDGNDGRLLIVAVADQDVPKAVHAIREKAKAHGKETPGQDAHGKILISYVDDFYTIRSARKGRDGPG
jgi:nitrogen regulatory protein PII